VDLAFGGGELSHGDFVGAFAGAGIGLDGEAVGVVRGGGVGPEVGGGADVLDGRLETLEAGFEGVEGVEFILVARLAGLEAVEGPAGGGQELLDDGLGVDAGLESGQTDGGHGTPPGRGPALASGEGGLVVAEGRGDGRGRLLFTGRAFTATASGPTAAWCWPGPAWRRRPGPGPGCVSRRSSRWRRRRRRCGFRRSPGSRPGR